MQNRKQRKISTAPKALRLKKAKALEVPVKAHPVLKKQFCFCFYKAALIMRSKLDQELQKFDLMAPHLGLLRVLKEMGPQSQVDLGDQMGIDKATMVKLIDTLEKRKFVLRRIESKDRRIKMIELTSKGESMMLELSEITQKQEASFLAVLTDDEKAVLRLAIPKLLASQLEDK